MAVKCYVTHGDLFDFRLSECLCAENHMRAMAKRIDKLAIKKLKVNSYLGNLTFHKNDLGSLSHSFKSKFNRVCLRSAYAATMDLSF